MRAVERGAAEISTARVRAGTLDAQLRFGQEQPLPQVTGRIVDPRGRGVGGVKVVVRRHTFVYGAPDTMQMSYHAYGQRTTTAADGTFTLAPVPVSGVTLELRHPELATHDYAFGDAGTQPHVEIQVRMVPRLRIELPADHSFARADRVRVLDARGERLYLTPDGGRGSQKELTLRDGRTATARVAGRATAVVFLAADAELGRLAVQLEPVGVTVVRP
ncbi:MAG: hypothetical protein AAF628_18550 [Planctomycetota bacterium]